MYHGHGEGEDKIEADRRSYLTRVGRLVAEEVYNTNHPLIVVATEEVAGHFISANDIEVSRKIHLSPDGANDHELKARIVEESRQMLRQSGDSLLEQLGSAIASESGSRDLVDIVQQAANGRVETLMIGQKSEQHGRFDRDSREVHMDDDAGTELINLAVRETINAGGTVVDLSDEDNDFPVAAIYRF